MRNRLYCNLRSGKFGRGTYLARRPIAYLGETSTWEFYFEDTVDAYGSALRNQDKDGSSVEVRIGPRGGSPILTHTSFSNLTSTVSLSNSFAHHKLTIGFSRSALDGFFTLSAGATATLAVATEYPAGTAVPALSAYSHTVLRDSTSGKIPFDASEAEIEDHIRAMFHELIAGVGGVHVSSAEGNAGVPSAPFESEEWTGYILASGAVVPNISASIISDTQIGVHLYVPDFQLQVPHVFFASGGGSSGLPSGTDGTGTYDSILVPAKGTILIDSLTATSSGLVGPKGKSASLNFNGGGFTSAIGSAKEVALWMEVDLDGETVCDGEILLKKPMS